VRAYCKKVFQPTRGEMVPLAIRQAWKTMTTGRPGPVVLDVPFDVFMEQAAEEAPNALAWNGNISSRCGADPDGVVKAVDMLLGADRPAIIVGQGVRYGGARRGIAEACGTAGRFRWRRPPAVSVPSTATIRWHWPRRARRALSGHHATRQADVLLAMGMRFDDRTSSSWIPGYSFTIPPTRLIHVDIDPEEIGRNYPVSTRPDGGRAHLPAAAACRTRSPRRSPPGRRRPQKMAGADRYLSPGMGQIRCPRFFR